MKSLSHRKQQKGAVLVLVTIALFTLLGFTALALDGGYLLLNKTRVQDAVDSAALSGAKTLNLTDKAESTHDKARDAVEDTLRAILTGPGFKQVNVDLDNLASVLDVEFSIDPVPFSPTTDSSAKAIRVSLNTVPVDQFLSQLFVDTWQVRASAVAAAAADKTKDQIIPLLMCAEDTSESEIDSGNFGFTTAKRDGSGDTGDIIVIKRAAQGANPIGPGNFLGLNFKCYANDPDTSCTSDPNGGGGSLYKDALSGKLFENSLVGVGDTITTLPGNKVGPSESGINTRFNIFDGDMKKYKPTQMPGENAGSAYYPDCKLPSHLVDGDNKTNGVVFDKDDFSSIDEDDSGSLILSPDIGANYDSLEKYKDYVNNSKNNGDACDDERRIVSVPVADCNNALNKTPCTGQCDYEVLGVSCFFLNQQVTSHNGAKGKTQYVVAEKIECGPNNSGFYGGGSEKIVLYDDTDSGDS
ncbi:pilus assembly protein TadG-related protein [Oceanisphaera sp. KMM 10153]|uniref:pilus assembly protein TadG-related protein n=1 Tax=Oceanisphaera submarina TaxID=3390193 RepID=UPI0039759C0E